MANPITQPVIDLHVHPSFKMFLFKKKLHKNYPAGGAWNPLTLRSSLPKMQKGGVRAAVCSHNAPEKKMIDDCALMKAILTAGGVFIGRWQMIVQDTAYEVTRKMIKDLEKGVAKARDKGWPVTIARSLTEFNNALAADKIVFLHAVEGAHALDRDLDNLQKLFDKGVCMLTPAHIYENKATHCVGGIPSDKKFPGCFQNEGVQQGGLKPFGKDLVDQMVSIGMIIDMTHATPQARAEIFQRNNNQRPLVMSHVGVHAMNPHPMNPTDAEIKKIADCGGVVGIIFYDYWLTTSPQKNGLDLIAGAAKHIKNIVNIAGVEHVAIGSDFDGFTDPPDDINDPAMFPDLRTALKNSGFTDADIEKIFEKNALRVIQNGWGRV